MNQVVLVGRLVGKPEVQVSDNGKKYTYITLAVARPFKNIEGIYETDFIRCVLWNGVAENTSEYCKAGDVIGIKGRLQNHEYETKENEKRTTTEVVAERVTFLSSKKNQEEK